MSKTSKCKVKNKKKTFLFIAGLIVLVAAAAAIIMTVVLNPAKEEKPAPQKTKAGEIEVVKGSEVKVEDPAQDVNVPETPSPETPEEAPAEVQEEEIEIVLESAMSDEVQAEIKSVTDAFLKGINEKNAALVMDYLTENIGATQGQLNGFFRSATGSGRSAYTLYRTYYVNNEADPNAELRIKKSESDSTYAKFSTGNNETCIAVFSSESEKVSQMITIVIIRDEGKFKIDQLATSDSGYYGKNALDYYKMAKDAKASEKEATAYVYAQMMNNICQPGNVIYYDETDEMTDYMEELSQWHSEAYPKQIIDDKHTVHMIGLALEDVGVVPMIFCQTEIDISGTDIQADAEKVKDAFLKENPDIAENFPKLVIHASNVALSEASDASSYKKIVFDVK